MTKQVVVNFKQISEGTICTIDYPEKNISVAAFAFKHEEDKYISVRKGEQIAYLKASRKLAKKLLFIERANLKLLKDVGEYTFPKKLMKEFDCNVIKERYDNKIAECQSNIAKCLSQINDINQTFKEIKKVEEDFSKKLTKIRERGTVMMDMVKLCKENEK